MPWAETIVAESTTRGASTIAGSATTKEQPYRTTYGQSGNATSVTIPVGIVHGATGTILGLKCGSIGVAVGAATVTVDLKKNGTTCLSGVVTLDSANVARVAEDGTLTVTDLVAGDFLELVIVATAGGGTLPTGLGVSVDWKEVRT